MVAWTEPVNATLPETPTPAARRAPDALLEVLDLHTHFRLADGVVKAVDGVSFSVAPGQTLGVVGESGCGKSVTSLSIMRLLDMPPAEVNGQIFFGDRDLLKLTDTEMRRVRGNDIAMIFQEPMTSLNPVFTIGNQIAEGVALHLGLPKKEAWNKAIEALRAVGINNPERRVKQYPHEMSGGMRQRAMIAMALACDPKLIIADEPTTALDVTIQAQILDLIRRVQDDTGAALLLITHDLGVVAETVKDIVVMYAGRVVEAGPVNEILLEPKHPYTEGLLASIPSRGIKGTRLNVIKGTVPNPFNMPKGCNFEPRCPYRFEPCRPHDPRIDQPDGPAAACWLWKKAPGASVAPKIAEGATRLDNAPIPATLEAPVSIIDVLEDEEDL